MRIMYRYLALFLSLVFLTSPASAGPGAVSEYGNFTGGPGWNTTQNASENYFYSDSGLICVVTGEVGGYGEEIYPDGLVEDITFLTDSPESELFPVWTADGNYIMYTVQRDGSENSESYIMKANGSEIEQTGIMEGNLTGFNDIDPNGTELVLTKSINSQPGLYLMSLENGTVTSVVDDSDKSEGWGAWCRLGRKIVYTQKSGDSPSQLWIVDRDGSNKIRLGTSEDIGIGKDWCPLGLKILYSAKNSKEKPDLWVIDWYGTNQTQLTDTPYGEWNPSFSPDGKRIVYVSDEGGKPEIWLRDIEGNYRARLTNNIGVVDSIPRWSPDGSKIVFTGHNLQNNSDNFTMINPDPDIPTDSNNAIIAENPAITNNSTAGDNSTVKDSYVTGDNFTAGSNSVIANNSATNGPDSTLGNGSTDSGMSGSEIAVIKLGTAPAVSSLPKVTSVKIDSPDEISKGGTVTISITVKNEGLNASEGYIWVSFPEGGELEKVEGTGSDIKIYPKGSLIQGKNGNLTAQYPLVKFVEYEWNEEQEENLNITLMPNNEAPNNETPNNETEGITFFVRAALENDLAGTYMKDPQFSEYLDQQGLEVYKYSVDLS
ncbi:TolB family protein [Methanosarcina sp.]|uniref:TolB family protein n=1 Tax=Methanosarcina sp. TaxID=2213 RepID=UPI003C75FEC1